MGSLLSCVSGVRICNHKTLVNNFLYNQIYDNKIAITNYLH